jgi:four helix bundle protein
MTEPSNRPRRERTRYEGLIAWQAAQAFAAAIYRATASWPQSETCGLTSQTRRAAVSVPANIAEGAAKRGSKEFRRFLDISLGSLAELHVYLLLAKEFGYLSPESWGELEALRDHTSRLTWGLYSVIGRQAKKLDSAPLTR